MTAVGAPGPMEMLIVAVQFFFGLSGGQMPLGMPPQQEQPVFSQVAPEECIYYTSMAGTAAPDPASSNKTEAFLAEPEVQAFIKEVDSAIRSALRKNRKDAPQGQEVYALAKFALTQPWCVFVSELKVDAGPPPVVKAGFLMRIGDKEAAFMKQLDALLDGAPDLPEISTVTINGTEYRQCRPEPGVIVTWGAQDGMFFAAIGEGMIEAMHERMKTPAPAWLTQIKEQLPVARRATVSYVNLAAIREAVLPVVLAKSPNDADQIEKVVKIFGLDKLKSLKGTTGLDEEGMIQRSVLESDGPLTGVWDALLGESLTAKDLAAVPADANVVAALKIDPGKLYRAIRETADKFEPGVGGQIEQGGGAAVAMAGFKNVEAALGSLGKTWTIYNSPSEGGPFLSGITLSVEVKEPFERVRKTVEAMLRMVGGGNESVPDVKTMAVGDTEVTYLQFVEQPLPIAPAWAIHDGRLIVSLIPQNVKAALSRSADAKSLASVADVNEALSRKPGPVGLFRSDPEGTVAAVYPILPYMAYTISSGLKKDAGIDFDATTVPALPAILPYLGPSMQTIRKTESGVEFEGRSTIPGATLSSGTAGMTVALLLPAVQAAREAARRAQSINNMKQIGLAMHNYHDARRTFPPAYSTDSEGKPLLSWRVHILPYVEEYELYKQFHLDEPWDSPHNKKLIPRMPQVYRSPNYPGGDPKTNYQTIRMEGSAFPGKEKIGIRDVRDGTSNTIMLVETNNDSAVVWTKPDDFVPDENNPMKGLLGLRPGIFNAAFVDGSVRSLSEDLDPEVLKCLFQRDDGKVVPREY